MRTVENFYFKNKLPPSFFFHIISKYYPQIASEKIPYKKGCGLGVKIIAVIWGFLQLQLKI